MRNKCRHFDENKPLVSSGVRELCENIAEIMRKLTRVLSKKQSERKPEDVDRREGRGAHMRVATQCKNTR